MRTRRINSAEVRTAFSSRRGSYLFSYVGFLIYINRHYENTPIQIYWKFYKPNKENFQIKNSDIFHILAQNIDCGYSVLTNTHSLFFEQNKKNNIYPCKPQFYYIKGGFKGESKLYRCVFAMKKATWKKILHLGWLSFIFNTFFFF